MMAQSSSLRAAANRAGGYDVFLDCWQSGVYCRQAGDTLAFSPPFIIEEGEIGQIFEIVADAIRRTD